MYPQDFLHLQLQTVRIRHVVLVGNAPDVATIPESPGIEDAPSGTPAALPRKGTPSILVRYNRHALIAKEFRIRKNATFELDNYIVPCRILAKAKRKASRLTAEPIGLLGKAFPKPLMNQQAHIPSGEPIARVLLKTVDDLRCRTSWRRLELLVLALTR